MARPLRLSFENAVYHIIARGNRKEDIFYSDRDRKVFLEKMNETFVKFSFICYANCLMDNHYHLFVKTPLANISEGMHNLNTSYANWFKAKHDIVGVVFQGRYKSILVDEDNYAIVVATYSHINPVRGGLVKDIENYKWSSYLDYIGKRKPIVERLDTSFILSQFDNDLEKAQKKYKKYVLENINMKNPFEDLYRGIALGSEEYNESIKSKIKTIGPIREIKETRFREPYKKEEIINKIEEAFGVTKKQIFKKERGNIYRQLALYLLKKYTDLSLNKIGELFSLDYSAVSQAVRRFKNRISDDKRFFNMKEMIIKELEKN